MPGTNSRSDKSNTFLRYAKVYDVLNSDKDYKEESKYIDYLINKFIEKPKNEIKILDLACGTGILTKTLSGIVDKMQSNSIWDIIEDLDKKKLMEEGTDVLKKIALRI